MRALQARMVLFKQRGQLTADDELPIQSSLRRFKSMFPNTPLPKHQCLDILLAPPTPGQPRNLIVRDLGAVQDDWLTIQFILAYFEGDGLSPPVSYSCLHLFKSFFSNVWHCSSRKRWSQSCKTLATRVGSRIVSFPAEYITRFTPPIIARWNNIHFSIDDATTFRTTKNTITLSQE